MLEHPTDARGWSMLERPTDASWPMLGRPTDAGTRRQEPRW